MAISSGSLKCCVYEVGFKQLQSGDFYRPEEESWPLSKTVARCNHRKKWSVVNVNLVEENNRREKKSSATSCPTVDSDLVAMVIQCSACDFITSDISRFNKSRHINKIYIPKEITTLRFNLGHVKHKKSIQFDQLSSINRIICITSLDACDANNVKSFLSALPNLQSCEISVYNGNFLFCDRTTKDEDADDEAKQDFIQSIASHQFANLNANLQSLRLTGRLPNRVWTMLSNSGLRSLKHLIIDYNRGDNNKACLPNEEHAMISVLKTNPRLESLRANLSISHSTTKKLLDHFNASELNYIGGFTFPDTTLSMLAQLRENPNKQFCVRSVSKCWLSEWNGINEGYMDFHNTLIPFTKQSPHPAHFLCAATNMLMEDPVIGPDGKNYENKIAKERFATQSIIRNAPLKEAISKYNKQYNNSSLVSQFSSDLQQAIQSISSISSFIAKYQLILKHSPACANKLLDTMALISDEMCHEIINVLNRVFKSPGMNFFISRGMVFSKGPDMVFFETPFVKPPFFSPVKVATFAKNKSDDVLCHFFSDQKLLTHFGRWAIIKKDYKFFERLLSIGLEHKAVLYTIVELQDMTALQQLVKRGYSPNIHDISTLYGETGRNSLASQRIIKGQAFLKSAVSAPQPQSNQIASNLKELSDKVNRLMNLITDVNSRLSTIESRLDTLEESQRNDSICSCQTSSHTGPIPVNDRYV